MAKKNKYMKGGCFCSIDEFSRWCLEGNWVYFGDRPKHPTFIMNMSFSVVLRGILLDRIRKAVPNA